MSNTKQALASNIALEKNNPKTQQRLHDQLSQRIKSVLSAPRQLIKTFLISSLVSIFPAVMAQSAPNLVANPSFENGLTSWTDVVGAASVNSAAAYAGASGLYMVPSTTQGSSVKQVITGLKPKTLYTFAVKVRARSASGTLPAFLELIGDLQRPKTHSIESQWCKAPSDPANCTWEERRFIVWTSDVANPSVTVHLYTDKATAANSNASFDEVRLVEGALPLPTPEVGQAPFEEPGFLPDLPTVGQNLVLNGNFETGDLSRWQASEGSVINVGATYKSNGTYGAHVQSSAAEDARIVQQFFSLAPNSTYTLTARVKAVNGGITVGVTGSNITNGTKLFTNTAWSDASITFTTGATFAPTTIMVEAYRGSNEGLVDDIVLVANGQEWLPTKKGTPGAVPGFRDDFTSNALDSNKWLILLKSWGGDNGGTSSQNVTISNGILHLAANGDQYNGPIAGQGGRKTRVGSVIVSRDYYASARYEVRARVAGPVNGVCTAFWTFHYLRSYPTQPIFWEEPSPVRNSEIDWEIPTAMLNDQVADGYLSSAVTDPLHIPLTNARNNTWGGKWGGEGGQDTWSVKLPFATDGDWHTYTIDWHSSPDASGPQRVDWYVDNHLVHSYKGAAFGQDNVPYIAGRFTLGTWFPASGWTPTGDVGWAGSPNFVTQVLDIDWISITPRNDANDRFYAEDVPNQFYATPDQYPGYSGATSPQTLTITAAAGPNGSINPSGTVPVNQGASQSFSITPASGYTVNAVTVDGANVGNVTSYTFSDVQSSHTINATFKASATNYIITANAGVNGSISPAGAVSVSAGSNKTFTITAASGYSVSTVTADGVIAGAVGSYTFNNVQSGHTISATFAPSGASGILLKNSGFENGLTDWASVGVTTSETLAGYVVGTKSGAISSSDVSGQLTQVVNVLPNTSYTLSGKVQTQSSSLYADIGVKNYSGNGSDLSVSSHNAGSWESKSLTFTTGTSTTEVVIYLQVYKNQILGQKGWFDELTLIKN